MIDYFSTDLSLFLIFRYLLFIALFTSARIYPSGAVALSVEFKLHKKDGKQSSDSCLFVYSLFFLIY